MGAHNNVGLSLNISINCNTSRVDSLTVGNMTAKTLSNFCKKILILHSCINGVMNHGIDQLVKTLRARQNGRNFAENCRNAFWFLIDIQQALTTFNSGIGHSICCYRSINPTPIYWNNKIIFLKFCQHTSKGFSAVMTVCIITKLNDTYLT